MVIGLIVLSASYMLLFFIPNNVELLNWIIFFAAILNGVGSNLYYMPAGTVRLRLIGKSKRPGFVSALYSANGILSGILAVVLALVFNFKKEIDLLFLFAGMSLIVSCCFLYFVRVKKVKYEIGLKEYLQKLSFFEHLACAETTHELRTVALPLVVLFSFGSIDKSIWISGVVAIGTILMINATGKLKDKNNNFLLHVAIVGAFLGWASYLFVGSEIGFIVAGIVTGMTYKMINSNFEARMGRCVANSECGLDVKLAFNFSQIMGRVFIVIFLIILYFCSGDFGKNVLFLGFALLIPKIIYTLRRIDELKKA
jgi:MFS family permease